EQLHERQRLGAREALGAGPAGEEAVDDEGGELVRVDGRHAHVRRRREDPLLGHAVEEPLEQPVEAGGADDRRRDQRAPHDSSASSLRRVYARPFMCSSPAMDTWTKRATAAASAAASSARVPSRSTSAGEWTRSATRRRPRRAAGEFVAAWTIASTPATASAMPAPVARSPAVHSTPGWKPGRRARIRTR